MSEREIAEKLLMLLYEHKDEDVVDFVELCALNNIDVSNRSLRTRILNYLFDNNYVTGDKYANGNARFQISYNGVADMEERLQIKNQLDSKHHIIAENTELERSESNNAQIEYSSENDGANNSNIEQFVPNLIHKSIIDSSTTPCFGVEKLAGIVADQIDDVCGDDKKQNVCMLGIFAPWGRGKTYLFNKVKNILDNRKGKLSYSTVLFNAWKYQETPAIWAYMYETLSNELSRRKRYKAWRLWKDFWKSVGEKWPAYFLGCGLFSFVYWLEASLYTNKEYEAFGFIFLIVIYLLKQYLTSPFIAVKAILKRSKTKSFANQMGLQNEIEQEIQWLLRFHTSWWGKSNKIVLYVDDIDRCPHEKMVQIIDSFRTVLENPEIKKRLVVVCSVDSNKLKAALKLKYKDLVGENVKNINKIIREQFDKLFLSGIGLPVLTSEQKKEFLKMLSSTTDDEAVAEPNENQAINTDSIVNRDTSWSQKIVNSDFSTPKEFTNDVLSEKIIQLVGETKHELTPRQLRIIYYRMILANNIFSAGVDEEIFREELLQAIVERSIAQYDEKDQDYKYKNIVDMVVPY